MIRTTIRFEDNIFQQARKRAIDQRIPFANFVNDALKTYLNTTGKIKKIDFKIKIYKMGEVRGNLSRTEIYQDV